MRKTIYLIRHGQARAGTANYDRLSSLGEQQASLLGQHLQDKARLPEEIWSGTLHRQQQSAHHFQKASGLALPINTDPRLNEYDHRMVHHHFHPDNPTSSNLEVSNDEDVPVNMSFKTYSSIIRNWANHSHDASSPDVESWVQFKRRTLDAMQDIARASTASTIALFTSGGVISVIAGQLEKHEDEHIPLLIWDLNNASINTIEIVNQEATLLSLNDVQHLEMHADVELVTKI